MEKYKLKKALEGKYGELRKVKNPPTWLFDHLFNDGWAKADHPLYFTGYEGIAKIYIVVSNQYDEHFPDEYWCKIPQVDERYKYSSERPFFHTSKKQLLKYVEATMPQLLNVLVK